VKNRRDFDVLDEIIAPGLSIHLGGMIAVVGLRGGSRVTGQLSARGLVNVAITDSDDDFTFTVSGRCYQSPSSLAQFLSPRVAHLQSIDSTIDALRIDAEDSDGIFGSVLEGARGGGITIDSGHWLTFGGICAALWNSEFLESVCGQLYDEVTIKNAVDCLQFLSAARYKISTELEFIASHLYDFLKRPDALNAFPFSII
jgi:hypothetical protein